MHRCAAPSQANNNLRNPLKHPLSSALNPFLNNPGSNNLSNKAGLSSNPANSHSNKAGLSNNPANSHSKVGRNRRPLWFNRPFVLAFTAEAAVSVWTRTGDSVRSAANKTSAIDASMSHELALFEQEHLIQPNAWFLEHP